jgi:ubiquinone/menaquinone biosynthesis C-methylase UbiE
MVGGPGSPSPAAAQLTAAAQLAAAAQLTSRTRAAYDSAADGWDDGPGRMYQDLARALVAEVGLPVAGQRVLDLGAGTGAAGAAALAAGAAQVVAADLAPAMLARCQPGLRPVAADAAALPFADRSFGLTLAAFCLGHLSDVPACLAQVRRVSSALAVSSFASGWSHPAKRAVDDVLAEFGYRPPDWYREFKQQTEPRSQDPDWLRAQLAAAGFADVRVRTVPVRTAVGTPAELAAWRLGMAHVAPFVAGLPAGPRLALTRAAEAAVVGDAGSLTVTILMLAAG